MDREDRIVWLKEVRDFRFVRVTHMTCIHRTRAPGRRVFDDRRRVLVGYGVPSERSVNSRGRHPYMRRVFYVRLGDFEAYASIGLPVEAVDPLTVKPNEPGIVTERAWGGTLPVYVWPRDM